ncbi:hypothetical protein P154DRAFT_536543 [Amniculicola lignicola CBS 123094]|uniref:Mid2 domain-containing protein n=1 Tax=Amniculicola lignicola CBS 123094 TaxID=1392246 RepID=A0A6A5W9N4_9PLEO|nr:hypothetical protein P154DRAFT_536543 [Amniculicola lignicola CBS 123094]
MKSHTILTGFGLLALCTTSTFATCYRPDGEELTDDSYEPCKAIEGVGENATTICCGSNRDTPSGAKNDNGVVADKCLPNGLCLNHFQDGNGVYKKEYSRGFCTESDWNSGKCLNMCTKNGNDWARVTPCNSENTDESKRWCCGDSKDCCNEDLREQKGLIAVFLPPRFLDDGPPVFLVASSSTTGSTTPTISTKAEKSSQAATLTPTPTPSTEAKSEKGKQALSTGVKVGIAVGIVVGAIIMAGVGFFIAKSRQWRTAAKGAHTKIHVEDHSEIIPVVGSTKARPWSPPMYEPTPRHSYAPVEDLNAQLSVYCPTPDIPEADSTPSSRRHSELP